MLNDNTAASDYSSSYPAPPKREEPAARSEVQPSEVPPVPRARFTHLLLPIQRIEQELQAVMLGVEMAALHRAKLTVLHVRPPVENDPSPHWLDAIDRLYQALDHSAEGAPPRASASDDSIRSGIRQFLSRNIPEALWNRVEMHLECRAGAFAEHVARFVDERTVDVLIMSSAPTRWWLPILPAPLRQVLRRTGPQVILVAPGARR